jgi:hypothetical protein
MSLYRRGDSWQCRIVHQGAKFQKSLGPISKAEARKAEAIWKVEIMRGEAVPTKVPTLAEFSTQFSELPSVTCEAR